MSQPPLPTLASTLYLLEQERFSTSAPPSTTHFAPLSVTPATLTTPSWTTELTKSIFDRTFHVADVFRGGTVVGVCGVDCHGEGDDGHRNQARRLIYNVVVAHLLSQSTVDGRRTASEGRKTEATLTGPSVHIIEPATTPAQDSTLLNVYDLLSTRLSQRRRQTTGFKSKGSSEGETRSISEDEMLTSFLSPVSLHRPFDLIGILQSLSEISEVVASLVLALDSHAKDHVVVLRGLSSTLSQLLQVSDGGGGGGGSWGVGGYRSIQAAALLSEILRQVERIARKGGQSSDSSSKQDTSNPGRSKKGEVLVIVELGAETVDAITSNASDDERRAQRGQAANVDIGEMGFINSAFSSPDGSYMKLTLHSDDNGHGDARHMQNRAMMTENTLVGLLEKEMDEIIAVHGGFGIIREDDIEAEAQGEEDTLQRRARNSKCLVEVVKGPGKVNGLWTVVEGRL